VRFSAKFAGALLGLATAGLLVTPVAAQAAPAVNADEVVKALGLASEPADYVVLVDTSGSMNQGGRYPAVRSQLRQLISGLDSDDRLSLLTFDSSVTRRYRGVVGTNPEIILAKLPATAAGNHTDIGAAIAGGLEELERSDTHRLTALILITDGELDTVPGAKYAKVGSAAWKTLSTRATTLAQSHEVAAYAVSLLATTDAGLLKKVFPRANEVSATEVGTRFAEVAGDIVKLQAAKALKDELAAPITVAWTGDLGAALANGSPVAVQLAITSPYSHVPVVLSNMTVQSPAGLTVVVTDLPDKITLEPGGTATINGQATVSGSPGSNATVSLGAKVTSPWTKVLEGDLGLKFAPAIEGTAAVPPAPLKLPPNLLPTVGAIAAVVVLGLLILFLGRLMLTPPMSGLLVFTRAGRTVGEVVLSGRRAKLVAPTGVTELTGLGGGLAGAWGPAKGQRAVKVTARFGEERARGLIGDGGVIRMGDMEIGYISDRRRILDKIGVPTEGTTTTN
jgi:hypothetical protein